MIRAASAASAVVLLAVLAGEGGCVNDVTIGVEHTAGAGGGGTSGSGAVAGTAGGGMSGSGGTPSAGSAGEAGGGAGEPSCQRAYCGGKLYACGNCDDDDQDGAIDSNDTECLGPCDDTEDSYYPGIPGQNGGSCRQDCYFDRGSGANDQCFSSFRCDPHAVAPSYPPSGDPACAYDPTTNIPGTNGSCEELHETQADACLESCRPLVPNGCDCFGCCELPAKSGQFVWIGSTVDGQGSCTEAGAGDPNLCHPCTPVPSCVNPCDECELCAGRLTPGDDCASSGGTQCPDGGAPCGLAGQPLCVPGQSCITGCCVNEPR